MKRVRIPLWQSVIISVATAVAAVSLYELVMVPEPPPPVPPQIVILQSPPADCPTPEAPPPVVNAADEQDGDHDVARDRFVRAVDLLRDRQLDDGCAMLLEVELMRADVWSAKAGSLRARRCD